LKRIAELGVPFQRVAIANEVIHTTSRPGSRYLNTPPAVDRDNLDVIEVAWISPLKLVRPHFEADAMIILGGHH
jgi:hypothetical protein